MFLKHRIRLMRKYDTDLWGFLYNRKRKNVFFNNFRLSLVNKLIKFFHKGFFKSSLKKKKSNFYLKICSSKSHLGVKFRKFAFKARTFFRSVLVVYVIYFLDINIKLENLIKKLESTKF